VRRHPPAVRRPSRDRPYGIVESARITGTLRYAELALFELIGSSAPGARPATAAVFLAGAARSHGWRAEQLAPLLPVSNGLPGAAQCTASPGPAFESALGALAAAPEALDGAELVDALVSALYPVLAASYEARLARCHSAPADQALARVLRRVAADLAAVVADGSDLLAAGAGRGDRRRGGADAAVPPGGPCAAPRAAMSPAQADLPHLVAAEQNEPLRSRVRAVLAGAKAPFGVPLP